MNTAFLISGGGTTMKSIIESTQEGKLKGLVRPALVIASNSDAGGIAKALALGIAAEDIVVLPRRNFSSREEFGKAILGECKKRGIDYVSQNGWIPLTPENVCEEFEGRIGNQHPAPLDTGYLDFGGKGMIGKAAHSARLKFVQDTGFRDPWTEATFHEATSRLDEGRIISSTKVPVLFEDTVDTLQQRVLPSEHENSIVALYDIARGEQVYFERKERLVWPGEELILEAAKQEAVKLYPEG